MAEVRTIRRPHLERLGSSPKGRPQTSWGDHTREVRELGLQALRAAGEPVTVQELYDCVKKTCSIEVRYDLFFQTMALGNTEAVLCGGLICHIDHATKIVPAALAKAKMRRVIRKLAQDERDARARNKERRKSTAA